MATLARGWRKRCPRCAGEHLFASFFSLHRECPDCGLVTRSEPGAMTGQMYLSAAVTEIVAAALVAIFSYVTLPRFTAARRARAGSPGPLFAPAGLARTDQLLAALGRADRRG